MQITKQSMLTGKTHTLDIPVTMEQIAAWQKGELIQRAMPNLTPSQREFLMTGSTDEEWKELFGDQQE